MTISLHSTLDGTRPFFEKVARFIVRWRIAILLLSSILVGIFELIEHPDFLVDDTYYFFKEIALYYILIFIIAIMVELAIKASIIKNQTIRILDARHNLSMQLISAKNWDEVVDEVLKYPSSILPVSAISLLIYAQYTDTYITERSWVAAHENIDLSVASISRDSCCTEDINPIAPNVHQVDYKSITGMDIGNRKCYHITINYADFPVGLLYIILPKNKQLTQEYAQLLSNTADDIAIGLNAAQQRQIQHAIEVSNAASNERLGIARDLHDTLGQNLGYMHLKLDQILTTQPRKRLGTMQGELEHLRELANEFMNW